LIKKEQKELEALQREESERLALEAAKKERDAKFRERAMRQKRKLHAYYASLKSQAFSEQKYSSNELPTSKADNIRPPPMSRSLAAAANVTTGVSISPYNTPAGPVAPQRLSSTSGVDAAKTAVEAYEAYIMATAATTEEEMQPSPLVDGDEEDGGAEDEEEEERGSVEEDVDDVEDDEADSAIQEALSLPNLEPPPVLVRPG